MQILSIPFRAITALFLRIVSRLLSWMGASDLARKVQFKAVQLENRNGSLISGLQFFGFRFLAYSDNHSRILPVDFAAYEETGYCRGACYWLIEKSLKNPHLSILDLTREFENGMPDEVVRLHNGAALPNDLKEEWLGLDRVDRHWNGVPLPEQPGAYTIRLAYKAAGKEELDAHRFTLFLGPSSYLFDPAVGLALFHKKDWVPHLKKVANQVKGDTDSQGFFLVEAFRHYLR